MCNFIKSDNNSCKIKSGHKLYCHIHEKYITVHNLKNCLLEKDLNLSHAKNEIKNLNKSIEKKVSMIKIKSKEIDRLNSDKKNLLAIIDRINQSKLNMQIDYNKYQLIKSFEIKRKQLIDSGIDIYSYNDYNFHQERLKRNRLAHQF